MKQLKRHATGFTLVELLVATAIALVLIGVTVALITSALQSEPRSTSRSSQIEAGRVMLERITRELREGCKVEGDEGAGLSLSVYMGCDGAQPTYTYVCSELAAERKCERHDVAADTSELMVSGLEDDSEGEWPVFTVENESYVEIQLRFPRAEADGESVTLSDGVAMRNQALESG